MINAGRKALLGVILLAIPLSVAAAPIVYELTVDGLACPFCSYGIEKQIVALKGVESIEVDIGEGLVVVTMAEGASLERAEMEQAVMDAGFTLHKVEEAQAGHRAMEMEKDDG